MTPYDRETLLSLIKSKCLTLGTFKLRSGKTSSYYLDTKKLTLSSLGSYLVGKAISHEAYDLDIGAVGGPELGAIPLVMSTVLDYHRSGFYLEGFFIRKESKDYGTKSLIEGNIPSGTRIAILEDVITTGHSALTSIKAVEAAYSDARVKVVAIISLIDRLEGGREIIPKKYIYKSVFSIKDLDLVPNE